MELKLELIDSDYHDEYLGALRWLQTLQREGVLSPRSYLKAKGKLSGSYLAVSARRARDADDWLGDQFCWISAPVPRNF